MDSKSIHNINKNYWDSNADALAKAGFVIEQMVEETDKATRSAIGEIDNRSKKEKMLPLSFIFKARKL